MFFARLFRSHRHTAGNRQTVTERTGRKLHPRDVVGNVSAQFTIVAVILIQPLQREKSQLRQRSQQCRSAVTFAQNKAVTISLFRIGRINI